jgi:hypothetical protein
MTERLYIRILRPFEERNHEVVGFPPSPRPVIRSVWEWRGIERYEDVLLCQRDEAPKPPKVVAVRTEDNGCLLVSTEPFAVRFRGDFQWQRMTGHVTAGDSPFLYPAVPVRAEELGRTLSVEEIRRLRGRIPPELHAKLLAAKLKET